MDNITNTFIQKLTILLNLYVFGDVHGISINEKNIKFIVLILQSGLFRLTQNIVDPCSIN